jgi:hypothetical protein
MGDILYSKTEKAKQEISHLQWNLKNYYLVHKSPQALCNIGLRNMLYCYGEKLLDLLNLQAEWHPLSAIREFLYNTLVNMNC